MRGRFLIHLDVSTAGKVAIQIRLEKGCGIWLCREGCHFHRLSMRLPQRKVGGCAVDGHTRSADQLPLFGRATVRLPDSHPNRPWRTVLECAGPNARWLRRPALGLEPRHLAKVSGRKLQGGFKACRQLVPIVRPTTDDARSISALQMTICPADR